MTFLIPATGAVLEYALTDSATDASVTTAFTFAGRSFGTAYADRYIVAAISLIGADRDATACSIGGITASKITGNAATNRASLWWAPVPTGTTGSVSITASAISAGCGLHLYSIYPVAPTNTSNLTTNGGSITPPSAGLAIGAASDYRGGSTPSMSISALTQDASVTWSASGLFCRFTVGSIVGAGAAITVTATGSTGGPYGFAVSAFGV